ncbi:MAG: 50S ribosomal protein L24 [Candidatus Nanohaloarchaea archaeon]
MVDKTENWSREWKSSKNPSKQRKYRENAPLHVKDELVSANLDPELRDELGTRNISLRTGDRVKVMRGDRKGDSGIVSRIDRENTKVYVNGIETERQDGSSHAIPLRPSNLQVTAINVEDDYRLEKYEIDDIEAVGVEEEEMEEALEEEDEESEMMQRMQEGEEIEGEDEEETGEDEETDETEVDEETESDESEEETSAEEAEEDTGAAGDYGEIVSGTISDAKDTLEEMENVDYKAALKAEKDNKNRTTFIDWLETRAEE